MTIFSRFWGALALIVLISPLVSCMRNAAATGNGKEITIGFYNVENLFDTKDDPLTNDNEFLPDGTYHWTPQNYQQKLENLSRVIEKIGDEDGPEILGLAEIENREVIEDLIKMPRLADRNYEIIHQHSPDQRGIDCALIYKKDAFKAQWFKSLTVDFPENPDIKTRDILMVGGKIKKGEDVVIFVNHWSSRRGGSQDSEFKRMRAASVVKKAVDELLAEDPETHLIFVGDFNDEPTDRSISEGLGAQGDMNNRKALYNPMIEIIENGQGSLMYKKKWDLFDQIIMTPGLTDKQGKIKYLDGSANVYHPEWMQVPSGDWKGAPLRSHLYREFKDNGFSDHFPVYARFVLL